MSYTLAIDQGTHASRACLFDSDGEMVFLHSENLTLQRIDQQRVEQDPLQIVRSVQNCVATALDEAAVRGYAVQYCGLATQRSSVLMWDRQGEALSPLLSWQDTRGETHIRQLQAYRQQIQAITGLPLSAHYGASKMAWLLQHTQTSQRDNENIRLSPLASYLAFHLLEQQPFIVDHVNAQRTQLFSLQSLDWSAELCEYNTIPLKTLPRCVPVCHQHGKLRHHNRHHTDIVCRAISGDQNTALYGYGLGANAGKRDSVLINLGSGAFVLQLLPQYTPSEHQLTGIASSNVDQVQYLREATINGAGSAVDWLQQQYPQTSLQQHLPQWLQQIAQPPVFINTIGGLGSPWWNPHIETEFIFDGSEPSLPEKAVAVIESIVFMLQANLDIMCRQQSINKLSVSGGLSQLDGLCQRLANLSGLTVYRSEVSEATARGIARLASTSSRPWPAPQQQCFEPTADHALNERYRQFNLALAARLS